MPTIGRGVHELRVRDDRHHWRLIYRIDRAGLVIAEVFDKATRATPKRVIDLCKGRYAIYDRDLRGASESGENP